jgi:hypothetical protein
LSAITTTVDPIESVESAAGAIDTSAAGEGLADSGDSAGWSVAVDSIESGVSEAGVVVESAADMGVADSGDSVGWSATVDSIKVGVSEAGVVDESADEDVVGSGDSVLGSGVGNTFDAAFAQFGQAYFRRTCCRTKSFAGW